MAGGKAYLVYPVIEESEQLPQLHAATANFQSIPDKFKGYQLHGRMMSDEKDDALRKFRSGETRILLATQVIEIGVDVPDASMMVVMNAERFGIAQLHQLRGRVGRGERKSKCVFLSSTSGTLDRLKVVERSSDGFYLANADLLLRVGLVTCLVRSNQDTFQNFQLLDWRSMEIFYRKLTLLLW